MERRNNSRGGGPSGGLGEAADFWEYTQFQPSGSEDDDEDPLLLGHGTALPRVTSNWRRAWCSVFKRSHDLEGARVNHQFNAEERVKLNNVESIDYLPPNSAMYRKWLAKQPHRRQWDRWLLMGVIGATAGLVAHMLYMLINLLAAFKYDVTRWLIAHVNITTTTSMVIASSTSVVGLAPEEQGS